MIVGYCLWIGHVMKYYCVDILKYVILNGLVKGVMFGLKKYGIYDGYCAIRSYPIRVKQIKKKENTMKKIIIAASLALCLMSCTDPTDAKRVLEAQGFKNIEITGYNFFGCGKDDTYHTGFIAIGQNGQAIEGTVCRGLFFKGSTVRY